MKDLIASLPKAELHLHIEGSLEPELMFELAQRNNIQLPYDSPEAIRAKYNFTDLQSFLDIYYEGASVLQTEQDFYDLTMAYCKRAAADNVKHAEIFFDPQTHTERKIDMGVVVNGIHGALQDAKKNLGLTSGLILCFLRHLPEDAAIETFKQAQPYLDKLIGVGLDSAEKGNPPANFQNVFKMALDKNLMTVAHAGEEGPPEYITQALDLLHVSRIDHGVRCIEDESLMERLAKAEIPLTVCPLSNIKLCVYEKMQDHPLKKLLDRGLKITINSDDPAYFGGYVNQNYLAAADGLQLSENELHTLADNSLAACCS